MMLDLSTIILPAGQWAAKSVVSEASEGSWWAHVISNVNFFLL